MQTMEPRIIQIFYCYAHKDERLRNALEKHLSVLKRSKQIAAWHDRQIEAGKDWEHEIETHLSTADLILLLVSSDFMASDYCYSKELTRAIERHDQKEAIVIPIILRPVLWKKTPIGKLQALPKDGKPVTSWSNRDQAFLNVAQGIYNVVTTLAEKAQEKIPAHVLQQMERWKELQDIQTAQFEIASQVTQQNAERKKEAEKKWEEIFKDGLPREEYIKDASPWDEYIKDA